MPADLRLADPPAPAAHPVPDLAGLVGELLEVLRADPGRLVETLLARVPDRLIDAKEFARLLAVSDASLDRLLAARRVLPPVRLAGSRRWVLSATRDWLAAGCPTPAEWEARRRARR